jgi:hypothetical protein
MDPKKKKKNICVTCVLVLRERERELREAKTIISSNKKSPSDFLAMVIIFSFTANATNSTTTIN